MKYKIVLVRPPFNGMGKYVPPHMGLCSIGAYINKTYGSEVNVIIIDSLANKYNILQTARAIIDEKPDLVFFTSKTMQVHTTCSISDIIKNEIETVIVVGGNHATIQPIDFLDNKNIDFCVLGEGELTAVELINYIMNKSCSISEVKGVAYIENNSLVTNNAQDFIINLDNIPFPDWSLLNLELYNENIHVNNTEKALPIMASRGCPYHCNFCSTYLTWGNRVRYRSVDSVISEIESNKSKYGINTFHFYDDNLLLDSKWINSFANTILEKKLNIEWICLSRPEIIIRERENLPLLKEAGCKGFELGFEAGNDEIYDRMNKNVKYNNFIIAFNLLIDNNFEMVELLLMNFYVGETLYSMWKSNEELKVLKRAESFILTSRYHATPFPGTEFYQQYKEQGYLIPNNFNYAHAQFLNFMPKSFLESRTKDFNIEVTKMSERFYLYFPYYDFIYKQEIFEIINNIKINIFLELFNSLLISKSTINDLCLELMAITNYSYKLEIIYELIGKLLIFSLDVNALKYSGEANEI